MTLECEVEGQSEKGRPTCTLKKQVKVSMVGVRHEHGLGQSNCIYGVNQIGTVLG